MNWLLPVALIVLLLSRIIKIAIYLIKESKGATGSEKR